MLKSNKILFSAARTLQQQQKRPAYDQRGNSECVRARWTEKERMREKKSECEQSQVSSAMSLNDQMLSQSTILPMQSGFVLKFFQRQQ